MKIDVLAIYINLQASSQVHLRTFLHAQLQTFILLQCLSSLPIMKKWCLFVISIRVTGYCGKAAGY
jgi:hypothetical protein